MSKKRKGYKLAVCLTQIGEMPTCNTNNECGSDTSWQLASHRQAAQQNKDQIWKIQNRK